MKIYTQKSIGVATFIGGPIASGILIYKNFIHFGQEREAKIAIISSIIFTIVLFTLIFRLPEEILSNIPNQIVPLIYTAIIYGLVERYQGEKIKEHLDEGGEKESIWKALGYGIIGLIFMLAVILTYAFSLPPFEGEKYSYVATQNSIYYENVDENKLRKLGEVLEEKGYFSISNENYVFVEQFGNQLSIQIPIDEHYWSNQDNIDYYKNFEFYLSEEVFEMEVQILLVSDSFEGLKYLDIE